MMLCLPDFIGGACRSEWGRIGLLPEIGADPLSAPTRGSINWVRAGSFATAFVNRMSISGAHGGKAGRI